MSEEALRYPDDAAVLAGTLAARADAIVPGDADLHPLGRHQGIPVLSTADCSRRITGGKQNAQARRPDVAASATNGPFPRVSGIG